jgi:hypothetical protein
MIEIVSPTEDSVSVDSRRRRSWDSIWPGPHFLRRRLTDREAGLRHGKRRASAPISQTTSPRISAQPSLPPPFSPAQAISFAPFVRPLDEHRELTSWPSGPALSSRTSYLTE